MTTSQKNFLIVMEESMRNKGTIIDHTIAHGVIVDPGRSGKNTLLKRLTGEGPPDPNYGGPGGHSALSVTLTPPCWPWLSFQFSVRTVAFPTFLGGHSS